MANNVRDVLSMVGKNSFGLIVYLLTKGLPKAFKIEKMGFSQTEAKRVTEVRLLEGKVGEKHNVMASDYSVGVKKTTVCELMDLVLDDVGVERCKL
jgi:hypothetical protein